MKKGISKTIAEAALIGLISGIIVIAFKFGIENLFKFVKDNFYSAPCLFVLITTLGGLMSGLLVCKFAPETAGSGIPYVKIALMKNGVAIRTRTVFVKFFAGILGIGTGLSLGREGPSVQLGAGAGAFVAKLFKLKECEKNNLIAAGAGCAIAATFNAPVAGTLFVLEELTRKSSPSMLFMCIIATVVSSAAGRFFAGANPAFNIHLSPLGINKSILIFCILTGIISGLLGVLFTKTIFFFNKLYSKIKIPPYCKPALAGFLTGIAGLFVPYILSGGNNTVEALLNFKFSIGLAIIILILKFFITPLCFSSNAAGGIFLPMLTIGALLGYILAFCMNTFGLNINLVAASAFGMAAFLSSVTRTPLVAAVMVFEMTGGYDCILPIMLTVAMAQYSAEKLNQKPIYATLAVNLCKNSGLNPDTIEKE